MRSALRVRIFFILLTSFLFAPMVTAQSPDANPYFARKNNFSVFGAYSNDSSHILLGDADNRKLLEIGLGYNRRLFVNRLVNWQYSGEILPVALESDPVLNIVITQTSPIAITYSETELQPGPCIPGSQTFSETLGGEIVYSGTETTTCGRRWTIGEAISPVGMQWNFRPRKKMQPFFSGHGGYMYSTQPIPVTAAGSFNFTFDLGAGVELYRSKTRSIRAEYRYHHISNHETATENPGIDNGLLQVTYSFGR